MNEPLSSNKTSRLVIAGFLLTTLYFLLAACVIYLKKDSLTALRLNEIGDLFAGMFAPLAFFWFVLGYFQQQAELRLNTDALNLQARELANSVEQQKELAEISRLQLARDKPIFIIDDEKKTGYQEETNSYYSLLRLVNEGGKASNVVITASNGLKLNQNHMSHVLSWPEDQFKEYAIATEEEYILSLIHI